MDSRFMRRGIHTFGHRADLLRPFTAIAVLLPLLAGCAVPVHQQRLVSQPNMQFSDSPVFAYQSRLLPQVESGAAASGGGQNAGCTSCR